MKESSVRKRPNIRFIFSRKGRVNFFLLVIVHPTSLSPSLFLLHSLMVSLSLRYSGKSERPATRAESANGCFSEDEVDRGIRGEESEGRAHKGLSIGLAALFLLAEMAGAGLLSLPRAVANTGEAVVLLPYNVTTA